MGHIPKCSSNKIDILTFEEAMKARDDSASYDRDKWIYYPDFYSEYRYILGTVGKNPLITIGINPSDARPDHLDNTLKSVNRLALSNGYDSFIMFNVYAQRATNPKDMDNELNEKLHTENMKAFKWILERTENRPNIWAAWGTIITKRPYLKECLKDMVAIGNEYNARWIRTGKVSKAGHPHHPLYLSNDSVFEDFDMNDYLEKLK